MIVILHETMMADHRLPVVDQASHSPHSAVQMKVVM